jgi:hypothetical protein
MNDTQPPPEIRPWSRAQPGRSGPRRSAGGLYRTAEGKEPGTGGVPLDSANAAVVAAVRLAYRVAEAQVDRSLRLARRLRETGDKEVGANSDTQGLDATERLVTKAVLSGLEWWEGSVAEGRCPVKRLAAAEYQMIGQILGFATPAAKKTATGDGAAQAAARPAAAREPRPQAAAPAPRLVIVHTGERQHRRRLDVASWELTTTEQLDPAVFFRHAEHLEADPIAAELALTEQGDVRLMIATPPQAMAGLWNCALCDAGGVQVGHIGLSL